MTKRETQMIAKTLRSLRPPPRASLERSLGWRAACNTFASELAKRDPQFDKTLFLLECDYAPAS